MYSLDVSLIYETTHHRHHSFVQSTQCAPSLRRREVIIGVPRVLFSSRIFHVWILAPNRKEHFFTNDVTCLTGILCLIKRIPLCKKSRCRFVFFFLIMTSSMTCFIFVLSVIYIKKSLNEFFTPHTSTHIHGVILREWRKKLLASAF